MSDIGKKEKPQEISISKMRLDIAIAEWGHTSTEERGHTSTEECPRCMSLRLRNVPDACL